MKAVRLIAVLGLAFGLAACGNSVPAARNIGMDAQALSVAAKNGPAQPGVAVALNVQEVRVSVPRKLRVSEANVFYPIADIVWRGEVMGDRYQQVGAIVRDGITAGTAGMTRGAPVVLNIEVTRFHSLTEKTRYTIGGTHAVNFNLTVTDAETGAVLMGPKLVQTAVKGAGGSQAIFEEQAGRTQRVVIVEHLAQVIRTELGAVRLPDGVPVSQLEGGAMALTVSSQN